MSRKKPASTSAYSDGTPLRVCIVGLGLSGLCAAVQLKRKLGLTKENLVVFEKAHDVGGVWLANTYPGCQADSPGWVYTYSFAKNPGWSNFFPNRDEIWAYLQSVAKKYGIYEHVQFNTELRSAVWDEAARLWTLTTVATKDKDGNEEERVSDFNIVIFATGPQRKPNYPPMFDSFSGPVMHSAEWNGNIKLENQVVGVIGNGASAAQILPCIVSRTKKTVVYMREPNYVVPKFQLSLGWFLGLILNFYPIVLLIRALSFLSSELLVAGVKVGSFVGRGILFSTWFHRWRNVPDKRLRAALTPRYKIGYKAPALADGSYFRAFAEPNVVLNRTRIASCEGRTLTTEDGRTEALDVLILCTGFKFQDFFAPIKVIGSGGLDLLASWKAGRVETFYGLTTAATPNLFFLLGPHGVSVNVIIMAEFQVNFIVAALRAMLEQNADSICVTGAAQAEAMHELTKGAEGASYMAPQPPGTTPTFIVDADGTPLGWTKTATTYWLRTRRLDPSKFRFTFRKESIGGDRAGQEAMKLCTWVEDPENIV